MAAPCASCDDLDAPACPEPAALDAADAAPGSSSAASACAGPSAAKAGRQYGSRKQEFEEVSPSEPGAVGASAGQFAAQLPWTPELHIANAASVRTVLGEEPGRLPLLVVAGAQLELPVQLAGAGVGAALMVGFGFWANSFSWSNAEGKHREGVEQVPDRAQVLQVPPVPSESSSSPRLRP